MGADGRDHRVAQMKAPRGGAVCFFHGEHPLSPLHEGGLVTAGTKYITRSDVLYKLPSAGKDSLQGGWQRHYSQMPQGGITKEMLLQMAQVATPAQRKQIEAMLREMESDDD